MLINMDKLTIEQQNALDWIRNRDKPQMADFFRYWGWGKGHKLVSDLALKSLIAYDNYSRLFLTPRGMLH